MVNSVALQYSRLVPQLNKINLSRIDLETFSYRLATILQEEIRFQTGWLFLLDPISLQPLSDSFYIATDPAHIEKNEVLLDPSFISRVDSLLKDQSYCIRGDEFDDLADLIGRLPDPRASKSPRNYFSFISLLVDDDKKPVGYFVFMRDKSKGRFTENEIDLMAELSPVVGNLLEKVLVSSKLFVSDISDEHLHLLVRRRAQPGILMLNDEGQILYLNEDAKKLLKALTVTSAPPPPEKKGALISTEGISSLPDVLWQLFKQLKSVVARNKKGAGGAMSTVNRICIHEGTVYLFRSLLLEQHGGSNAEHVMILIEKVSKGVRIDQFVKFTKLTEREQEVVRLLLEGKTNKEVAVSLNIGEYTVKDHIKRIMKKLNVTTRTGIVAKVLNQHRP